MNNATSLALSASGETADETRRVNWLSAVRFRGRDPAEARKRFSQRKLGEILVMLGLVTSQDRDRVLERQQDLALPFGECCIRLGLIDADELSHVLAWQFGYSDPVKGSFTFRKDLVTVSDPFGPYAEALRSVSCRLMSRWIRGGEPNLLAITSAQSGEGRSHVAANLAVSFCQAGLRTLLIDADFRNPKQHLIFCVPQHPGLSRLLCGFTPKDVANRIAPLGNLTLITSGPVPPNPVELLGRKELAMFMQHAGENYDVVLVDTPAGTEYFDTELIASATGVALIVARVNRARQRKVENLAQNFAEKGIQIAGTLTNMH